MLVRDQTELDNSVIEMITIEVFRDHAFSSQTEQHIIRALRGNSNLPFSLVAETQGNVVGHIALSLVSISDGKS